MERRSTLIIGFSFVLLLVAVAITVSVYFILKGKNQTSLPESSSNTTITTTFNALTGTSMNTTSIISTSIISTSSTAVNITLTTNTTLSTSIINTIVSTSSGFACELAFKPMTSYTPVEYVASFSDVIADLNGDSYLDIIVANDADGTIVVFLGNGDGTFQPERTFLITNTSDPFGIVLGDVNNDNRLDIIVANGADSNIAILLGNGDGTLTVQKTISTGSSSFPFGLAVGYFNNDSALDIAFANIAENKIGIFLGNGNGTFRSQKTYPTGSNSEPAGIAVGDFNHDNYLDLVVANSDSNKVGVFTGYGDGTFRSQISYSVDTTPVWINVADFNGDTHLDIAVLNTDDNNVGILLGNGNGTFRTQTTYRVGNSSSRFFFVIADANNDGRWDIVIPNTAENNIGILLGKGDGSFNVQTTFSTGIESEPNTLSVADFNNDNHSDIVVLNSGTGDIGILLGTC